MALPDSLFETMNAVSRGLDAPQPVRAASRARLTDFDLLLEHDPLFARLHKDHCDARDTRIRAEKDFGADNDMTMLAADLEDSAWCRVQTRYLELRAEAALMQTINTALKEMRDEEERLERLEQEKAATRFFEIVQILIRMRKEGKGQTDVFAWGLLLLLLYDKITPSFRLYQPVFAFNRMAA